MGKIRDAHFANFARTLRDKIMGKDLGNDEIEKYLRQRAYDLVQHTLIAIHYGSKQNFHKTYESLIATRVSDNVAWPAEEDSTN